MPEDLPETMSERTRRAKAVAFPKTERNEPEQIATLLMRLFPEKYILLQAGEDDDGNTYNEYWVRHSNKEFLLLYTNNLIRMFKYTHVNSEPCLSGNLVIANLYSDRHESPMVLSFIFPNDKEADLHAREINNLIEQLQAHKK